MFEKIIEDGLYGYITDTEDYINAGKGVVKANSETEAKRKVINAYIKHGHMSHYDFDFLTVWKITSSSIFKEDPDVMEI